MQKNIVGSLIIFSSILCWTETLNAQTILLCFSRVPIQMHDDFRVDLGVVLNPEGEVLDALQKQHSFTVVDPEAKIIVWDLEAKLMSA